MDLVYNCSFTLTTGREKKGRLRCLKNGSVQALLLFNINIYTHNLPPTTSKLFAYADDLALVHPAVKWISLERTLNQDMATLSYLEKQRLI